MSVSNEQQSGRNFTALEVWKKMRLVKIAIEKTVKTFPREENFRLSDQLIRSARSVNSNIAEGHGRYTFPDQIHFCIIARGSLSETLNHLIDAFDCGYLTKETLISFRKMIQEVEKLLNGYINWLKKGGK